MDLLAQITKAIDVEMIQYNKVFESYLVHSNPLMQAVFNSIIQRRGKMMRPILTILSAKLINGKINENALRSAATLEFFHTASLIHDDVVDESDERRGQKAVHSSYGNKFAVLIGDYILANSLHCVSQTHNPRLVEVLSVAAQNLAAGEILQLSNVRNNMLSEDVYFEIIKGKTAALFKACAEAGAIAVSSDEMAVETMAQFGQIVGICFQIRDDIFDYGHDEAIGKPTGNDMKEGKLTLPAIYAVNTFGDDTIKDLALKVKEGNVSQDEIDSLVNFTIKHGGIDYAEKVMFEYADKAKRLLDAFPDSEIKQLLNFYIDYVVNRSL